MARQRMLHPGFFTDSKLLKLSPLHRLLFQGLWCLADREGRLKDAPDDLKIALLPGDDCDVDVMLDDLARAGRVVRYESGAGRLLSIPRFRDYQHPHKNEPSSKYPSPPEMAVLAPVKALRTRAESESESESEYGVGEKLAGTTASPPAPVDVTPQLSYLPPDATGAPPAAVVTNPPPGTPQRETSRKRKPPEGADTRHAPLVAALCAVFLEERGVKYGFGGQDAREVSLLLQLGDAAEVERRWRRALRHTGFPAVSSVAQLRQQWNHFAGAGPPKDIRKGRVAAEDVDWSGKKDEVTLGF